MQESLGIHRFPGATGPLFRTYAYFVIRPFGNLLFFPSSISSVNSDFIRSRGGINKLLDWQLKESYSDTSLEARLFREFGSSLVVPHADFRKEVKVEQFGCEFVEHGLSKHELGFMLDQRGQSCLFLDDRYIYRQSAIYRRDKDEIIQSPESFEWIFPAYEV